MQPFVIVIYYHFDVDLNKIIKYQDHHNCQRIYQAVLSKLNKNNERI